MVMKGIFIPILSGCNQEREYGSLVISDCSKDLFSLHIVLWYIWETTHTFLAPLYRLWLVFHYTNIVLLARMGRFWLEQFFA